MAGAAYKKDILEQAVVAINQVIGQRLTIAREHYDNDQDFLGATLYLNNQGTLYAQVKKWAAHSNIGTVINQLKQCPEPNVVLAADYITPQKGKALKQAEVQFIDTAGNAYINQGNIFVYVMGNKPEVIAATEKPGKAFQTAGMKVVYAFLLKPELLNAPYRTIAEQAGTALATVGAVIRDLAAMGYIRASADKDKRVLQEKGKLIDQWAEAYPHVLRNKHHIGTFTTNKPDWWKNINPAGLNAQWGGEVAAEKYTNYLNAAHTTTYIKKAEMGELMRAGKLRKMRPNERRLSVADLYEPFWTKYLAEGDDLVHPLIVYADLISTADPRNIETAQRVYEKYLR